MSNLTNVSPIDGRYHHKTKFLSFFFSEFALIKKRVYVELAFLKELGKGDYLSIHANFSLEDAEKIKEIENTTNHDVKAVEYFIKEKVSNDVKEFVHFGLTSEDINNLSYSLLMQDFIHSSYSDKIKNLLDKLDELKSKNKAIAMLARTHGQPASPTTLGKEINVFYQRLKEQFQQLREVKLTGKLNGATGNFSALKYALPETDWIKFSQDFIHKIGLKPSTVTTQINAKDSLVELLHVVKRINTILLDLCQDIWTYISFGYFNLKKKEHEVGSSTMPHKVNPIDFENAEGNLKVCTSLITCFESLQISRMQRDLSDSTIMRNIGVVFAHACLAYDSLDQGLEKLSPNIIRLEEDLKNHPEVIMEAIQTVLRSLNYPNPYEVTKVLSRGNKISLEAIHQFIESLDLSSKDKSRLKKLKPSNYIGLAVELASTSIS